MTMESEEGRKRERDLRETGIDREREGKKERERERGIERERERERETQGCEKTSRDIERELVFASRSAFL